MWNCSRSESNIYEIWIQIRCEARHQRRRDGDASGAEGERDAEGVCLLSQPTKGSGGSSLSPPVRSPKRVLVHFELERTQMATKNRIFDAFVTRNNYLTSEKGVRTTRTLP